VLWVPFHMMEVLRRFGQAGDLSFGSTLLDITRVFAAYVVSKEMSGDPWEALFVVTLLIRALSRTFDCDLFKLSHLAFEDCSVSFNDPFLLQKGTIGTIENLDAFLGEIPHSFEYVPGRPHIAIYYPGHGRFPKLDVIVAAWSKNGAKRQLYGYQLRAGNAPPDEDTDQHFIQSWVVRGHAPQSETTKLRWANASEAQNEDFFGKSGSQWTRKMWDKLTMTEH
jgi:hypothetical protein